MYKALALDLDGTLTDSRKRITEKTKAVLFAAMDKGVKVILASGRPLMGVTAPARELELSSRGGFIMAFNGGVIVDCKSGAELRRLTVPESCVGDICLAARRFGCAALTYTADKIVTESPDNEYVLKEKICTKADIIAVDDLAQFVDYPTPKFLIAGPHECLAAPERFLRERRGGELNIFYSEGYFLEVCPKGVSKSSGLGVICDYLGISPAELMACGDGMNDIPMLDFAGLAVAMENACPEAVARADYVTLSNDRDGVAEAVKKFILK